MKEFQWKHTLSKVVRAVCVYNIYKESAFIVFLSFVACGALKNTKRSIVRARWSDWNRDSSVASSTPLIVFYFIYKRQLGAKNASFFNIWVRPFERVLGTGWEHPGNEVGLSVLGDQRYVSEAFEQ